MLLYMRQANIMTNDRHLQLRAGLSLLELLIVLVIVGLLSSLAIPKTHDTGETEVRRTAQVIATQIATVRAYSRARGVDVRFQFQADGILGAAAGTTFGTPYSSANIGLTGAGFSDALASGLPGTKIMPILKYGVSATNAPTAGPLGLALPSAGRTTFPGDSLVCQPSGACLAPAGNGAAIYLTHNTLSATTWAITVNHAGRVKLWQYDRLSGTWK